MDVMPTSDTASAADPARRVAFITGSGARRVGRAVAELFAARGYAVVLHANSSLDAAQAALAEFERSGTPGLLVQGDVREEAVVQDWVARIVLRFGRLDVLVNAAAVWKRKPLEEVTAADVREHFDVNALGTFLCSKHCGLQMVRQPDGGAIVNVGDWATRRPYTDYAAYFPSKGAVPTMTRLFAVELARRNPKVRVNAVLPGPVMLPADLPQSERDQAISATLVRREGSPQQVAQAVWALVENEFITGACLPVDGGRTIAM
jgi:pteridine reductase